MRPETVDVAFESERFYARPWRPSEDAEAAFAMYGDPEMVRYIGGEVLPSIDVQRERLEKILDRNLRWGGRYGSWPWIEKTNGQIVGTAILKPPPASGTGGQPSDDVEIGWHVLRSLWGRGIATEMARTLLRHGFEVLALPILHAVVDSPNLRSQAVARRIGMRHTGKTARYYDLELEHFELDAGEWRSSG